MKDFMVGFSKKYEAIFKNLANGRSRVAMTDCAKYSPHIKKVGHLVVDNVSKKSSYKADIIKLRSDGVKIKDIAKLLNISESYAYELSKK